MSKIIHQIFFEVGKYKLKDLPQTHPNWVANMKENKRINPSYRHIFWNDKTAMSWTKKNYPELMGMIKSFPHGFYFIDFFRYLVLSKMGGVYIDLDVRCKKPLPDVETILGEVPQDYDGRESINNNVIKLKKEDAEGLRDGAIESYKRVKNDNMWAGKPLRRLLWSVGAKFFKKYCRANNIKSDVKFKKYFFDEQSTSWMDKNTGLIAKGSYYVPLPKKGKDASISKETYVADYQRPKPKAYRSVVKNLRNRTKNEILPQFR